MSELHPVQKGLVYAVLAFGLWGFGPIYFKAVASVQPGEVLAHRIIWSVAFLVVLLTWNQGWQSFGRLFLNPEKIGWLLITALLVSANWLTFIWAVTNDRILEASLGYFINPLFSIFLGMLFLGERLRPMQIAAFGLAVIGVANQIFSLGVLPWVAIALTVTFGFYGLLRKMILVDPVQGLAVETVLLFPFALGYLYWLSMGDAMSFLHIDLNMDLLLVLAGAVTTLPLIFFAAATNRLSLTLVGFLQYIAPSITFLLAILLYHEPLGINQLITFGFIWAALGLFSLEGWYYQRKQASMEVLLQDG